MNAGAAPSDSSATLTPVASLWTPAGRGAVATVRFEGDCRLLDDADPPLFAAANHRPLAEQPLGRIVFGRWGGNPPEDVVICRIDDCVLEIHCHGGRAAAARVLDSLATQGCRIEPWQDALHRRCGLFEVECAEALFRATTSRTAALLLAQYSGVLRRELEELRFLAQSAATATAANVGDRSDTSAGGELVRRLDLMLGRAEFGLHLVRPWRVVLSGRPNVGKSSLINALVGYQRAIVYDQPGTTRDVVTAETALDGWPFEFADTAGLRTGGDELETAGIARARETLARADCRVLVFDASEPIEADDLRLLAEWPNAIVVANKCDLAPSREASLPPAALRLSALTGNGLDSLAREIVRRVVPNPPAAAEPIPVTERQIDLLRRAHAAAIESRFADAERALSECLGARQVTDGTTMPAEFRTPRS